LTVWLSFVTFSVCSQQILKEIGGSGKMNPTILLKPTTMAIGSWAAAPAWVPVALIDIFVMKTDTEVEWVGGIAPYQFQISAGVGQPTRDFKVTQAAPTKCSNSHYTYDAVLELFNEQTFEIHGDMPFLVQ
jgi:hypothetical protein